MKEVFLNKTFVKDTSTVELHHSILNGWEVPSVTVNSRGRCGLKKEQNYFL